MFSNNPITKLFACQYPIIQGGMVWNSGWKLASAVTNAGGVGLIGSGSMTPDVLQYHIQQCKKATKMPFGVNIPLIYTHINKIIDVILKENIKIVFTSAGNPKTWTPLLKQNNIIVAHVVSNVKFAQKTQDAGVDAIVCEGFEAGGHNGKDEITTFCLIPQVRQAVTLPLIAAGGIATGAAMLAAIVLGADAVQIGTRFAATLEASSHTHFKNAILNTNDDSTMLTLKKLNPVRLIKNKFYEAVNQAEKNGASETQLLEILGKNRSKLGIFEGDLDKGKLEIGQIAGIINQILPAQTVIENIIQEYINSKKKIV